MGISEEDCNKSVSVDEWINSYFNRKISPSAFTLLMIIRYIAKKERLCSGAQSAMALASCCLYLKCKSSLTSVEEKKIKGLIQNLRNQIQTITKNSAAKQQDIETAFDDCMTAIIEMIT